MLNTAYKWEEAAHPKRDSGAVASEVLSTALSCFCNASDLFKLRASREFNDFVIATAELQVVSTATRACDCCSRIDTCHRSRSTISRKRRRRVSLSTFTTHLSFTHSCLVSRLTNHIAALVTDQSHRSWIPSVSARVALLCTPRLLQHWWLSLHARRTPPHSARSSSTVRPRDGRQEVQEE